MIHRYWMTIFHMINMIYDLSLLVDSKIGLLGILPGIVEGPKAQVITRILYVTRKRIAKLWVSPNPFLVAHWVAGVNCSLERENYTQIGTIHRDFFPCGRIGFLFWQCTQWDPQLCLFKIGDFGRTSTCNSKLEEGSVHEPPVVQIRTAQNSTLYTLHILHSMKPFRRE